MRKWQSKRMLGGVERPSKHLGTRGRRRGKPGSWLKTGKFRGRLEEQLEGSKVFGTSPEDRVHWVQSTLFMISYW